MTELYWYTGKSNISLELEISSIFEQGPVPQKKITEIHFIGPEKTNYLGNDIPFIKVWPADMGLDLMVLLLNRIKHESVESSLILQQTDKYISYGLFGKANLVGRYNIPPEFEILSNGWIPDSTFFNWINQTTPQPTIYTDSNENPMIKTKAQVFQNILFLDALVLAKQSFLAVSKQKKSITFIHCEKI